MAYKPKTVMTDQNVEDYLQSVSEKRREEAYQLIDMMQRVTGQPPRMWGPSMIGFGSFHYISKSKCEADWFKVGFSPRKAKLSLYINCDTQDFDDMIKGLGKHTRGKGCVYANKLADIDMDVLEQLTAYAYEHTHDYDASK